MIRYQDKLDGINTEKLKGFFVGWLNPLSEEKHLALLEKSDYIWLAIDDEANIVVGFITAVSDNVLSAYIPLLEVLPQYQKRGIGTELVRRMLKSLEGLYMVDLCCDEELAEYYKSFGMFKTTGMIIRNYDRQKNR